MSGHERARNVALAMEFLVELYVSTTDADAVKRLVESARTAAEQQTGRGVPVRHLRSIFVPEEETCFHVLRRPVARCRSRRGDARGIAVRLHRRSGGCERGPYRPECPVNGGRRDRPMLRVICCARAWRCRWRAYGGGGAVTRAAPVSPKLTENRVSYARGPLRDWCANGPLGLEPGFDLVRSPIRGSGPLTLTVEFGGNLTGRLEHGNSLLVGHCVSPRYGELHASDARGYEPQSSLALAHRRLLLRVDDRGARYPLSIGPFIHQAVLKATDDEFGSSFGPDDIGPASQSDLERNGGWNPPRASAIVGELEPHEQRGST